MRIAILSLTCLALLCPGSRLAGEEQVVFVTTSDTHFGAGQGKGVQEYERILEAARSRPREMVDLIGTAFPAQIAARIGGTDKVPSPQGILVVGDLTDGSTDPGICRSQWSMFTASYPALGLARAGEAIPVFPGLGNHDGGLTGVVGREFLAYLDQLGSQGRIASRDPAGFHYALHWGRLHLLCLNLCAADATDPQEPFRYGAKGQGSWNDPKGALRFLTSYLSRQVGTSGDPVVILMHYGFDRAFSVDWSWWSKAQRAAFYDALEPYRVIALIHGHNHHADHYRWPDPKLHPDDLAVILGGRPGPAKRQYEVFSNGGICWWFILKDDRLIAIHRDEGRWSESLSTSIPLAAMPGNVQDQGR